MAHHTFLFRSNARERVLRGARRRRSRHPWSEVDLWFDAATRQYVDMFEAGIVDGIALENAVSVTSLLPLTEATPIEIPEKETRVRAAVED